MFILKPWTSDHKTSFIFLYDAGVGDRVTLDTESFHGDYTVTGIMDIAGEKEMSACAFDKIARTVCAAVFS